LQHTIYKGLPDVELQSSLDEVLAWSDGIAAYRDRHAAPDGLRLEAQKTFGLHWTNFLDLGVRFRVHFHFELLCSAARNTQFPELV
jgi:hypothetical protein